MLFQALTKNQPKMHRIEKVYFKKTAHVVGKSSSLLMPLKKSGTENKKCAKLGDL